MTTVYTIAGLESALKRKERNIVCRGGAATAISAKAKKHKCAIKTADIGLLVTIGGIALAPHTGDVSALAVGPAICALTAAASAIPLIALTAAIIISTTKFAILVDGPLAMISLIKGRRIRFNTDGRVLVDNCVTNYNVQL